MERVYAKISIQRGDDVDIVYDDCILLKDRGHYYTVLYKAKIETAFKIYKTLEEMNQDKKIDAFGKKLLDLEIEHNPNFDPYAGPNL